MSVATTLANVAEAVPAGTTRLTVNVVAVTAVTDALVAVYAVTEGATETLSPTANAPPMGAYVKVTVVEDLRAVAVKLKLVTVGVLAGTDALTVNEVVVRAVMTAFVTAYGAGAATLTLSPTANAFEPEFVKVIVVPALLTVTGSAVVTETFAYVGTAGEIATVKV